MEHQLRIRSADQENDRLVHILELLMIANRLVVPGLNFKANQFEGIIYPQI